MNITEFSIKMKLAERFKMQPAKFKGLYDFYQSVEEVKCIINKRNAFAKKLKGEAPDKLEFELNPITHQLEEKGKSKILLS